MLKHREIIEKLSPLQKVALVASAFGEEPLSQAGIPAVVTASLGELAERGGVDYASAVRSWDPKLVGEMTEELVAEAGEKGVKLVKTPDLKVAVDPYGKGLSEDSLLLGAFGAEMTRGAHAAGAAVGLSRLSVDGKDIAYLDRKEDPCAVYELVEKPFRKASETDPCDAVYLKPNREGMGYRDTNRALLGDILNGYFGKDVFAVGEDIEPSSDMISLIRGKVTLDGARLSLERAVRRYLQLVKYREEGSVTDRDLEDALRDGSALDDKTLDSVVDEIIDFAIGVSERKVGVSERLARLSAEALPGQDAGTAARRRLAAESIVLLKNDGTLPLRAKTKIALVGEVYADTSALETRFTVVGRARGYDRETERSDALIPEAVRAANAADVVLVFLYPDSTGCRLGLPANRLALLSALVKARKKVIALVCGGTPVDMKFDAEMSASLFVPADGPFSGEGLARVLLGEVNPCGRLVRTPFDDADEYFHTWKKNKDLGRMRVGAFVGYTRYTTAEEKVRYPFGYGLSYTKFTYSNLRIKGDEVSFTLRNRGKYDGSEVVQLYIGAPSVTHVAAKKLLIAFRKVFLKAGESARVSLTLPQEAYATYDPRCFTENVEKGIYRIYVGTSAQDVKLQGKRMLDGIERETLQESNADYFPNGEYSDVADVRRESRLNETASRPPAGLTRCRKAAIYAMPVIAFLFFLLVSVLILSYALDYVLLTAMQKKTVEWLLFVLAVVVLTLIPLLGSLNRRRLARWRAVALVVCPILIFLSFIFGSFFLSEDGGIEEKIALSIITCFAVGAPLGAVIAALAERALRKTKSGANRWAKYYFECERDERVTSEAEFEEAFRAAEEARREAAERAENPEKEEIVDFEAPQFYDGKLTYAVLLRDLKQFVGERGLIADEATLWNWVGALASSQLLIIPEGDGARFGALVAEYFGKKAYIDNAEQYVRYEDLFSQWKQGGKANIASNLSAAFSAAKRESAYLHTVILRHMDVLLLEQVFTPVAEVIAHKKAALELSGDTRLVLPPNLRIVVELDRPYVGDLPRAIAEVASVLSPVIKECTPAEKKSIVQIVGFERFSALRRTVRDKNPIQEHTWKKVDSFDEKCRTGHIGNFIWVKMELHASVVKACGGSESEALDGALSSEVMPWIRTTWRDVVNGCALGETLEEIFGAGNVALSLAAIEKHEDEAEQ